MFFRISLSGTAVFLIIIWMYWGISESVPAVTIKNGINTDKLQTPHLQTKLLQSKNECKSYINAASGKICIPPSPIVDNINSDMRDNPTSQEDIGGFGDFTSLQSSSNDLGSDVLVPIQDDRRIVKPSVIEHLPFVPNPDEIKVEPGTIFIPFATKDCGWFCKK